MPIAEEIYAEVKTLPDELAREVLDFVHFIENRYALRPKAESTLTAGDSLCRIPGSAKGKLRILNEDDEHLQDFSFPRSRVGMQTASKQNEIGIPTEGGGNESKVLKNCRS